MTAVGATRPPVGTRRRRVTAPLLLAGLVLGASVLLHLRDPHRSGSYLFCPWLVLTGTYCPACGGLRAVNDLTHGDVLGAASSNILLVGGIPLAAWAWSRWLLDRWRGVTATPDARRVAQTAIAVGVLALVFWVARNLPALGWLAP